MTMSDSTRASVDDLVGAVAGADIRWTPDDDGRIANTEVVDAAAGTVTCADTSNWPRIVGGLYERGVRLAVRGGGWSPGGRSTRAGAVVLSTSANRDTTITDTGDLRVEAGTLTGAASARLDAASRAMTLPVPSEPGLIGASLAGGVGFTFRRDGFICDALQSITMVTAAGDVIDADDTTHPELMRAVRGAGYAPGLITSAVFTTRPLSAIRVQQQIIDIDHAVDALMFYDAWTRDLSADVTSVVMIRHAPPVPGIDTAAVGRPALVLTTVHSGDLSAADADLVPLDSLAGVLFARRFDTTLHQLRAVTDAGFTRQRFGIRTASGWSAGLSAADVEAVVALSDSIPTSDTVIEVAALGGAIAGPARPSCAAGRDQRHLLNVMTIWNENTDRERALEFLATSREVIRRIRVGTDVAASFADVEDLSTMKPDEQTFDIFRQFDPDHLFTSALTVKENVHVR
ncbi:FAD-binding oxidoreductase [Gordonia sp. TBRC 11910]|uniref:FAD-binding oxidoreductase n=1 Tax=Gordonia asplenii TaxID=2725283 RepID=A0A848L4Q0_9ACTN|nr:FAD-binding protein [Gordonia asplenii]NMO03561.1 FAD-binding oxidoreductase [Gordonia asplenii]